jgi:fluoride exporter
MTNLLLVGCGGFIGSICRYSLNGLIQRFLSQPWLPYGTLVINILGCFLIGLLSGLSEMRQFLSPEFRLMVFIGLLGGFTTFSTFGYESYGLAKNGNFSATLFNIAIHVIFGLFAVWLGDYIAKFKF